MIRPLEKADVPILREIHARAGYGFEFPDIKGMTGVQVIEDEEGKVVGFIGAQIEAQIFGVFDPLWGSPGERMSMFASIHRPIAEFLKIQGVREVYVAVDPSFPAFGRRLMGFGWRKALWDHYWMPVSECLARFRGKEGQ